MLIEIICYSRGNLDLCCIKWSKPYIYRALLNHDHKHCLVLSCCFSMGILNWKDLRVWRFLSRHCPAALTIFTGQGKAEPQGCFTGSSRAGNPQPPSCGAGRPTMLSICKASSFTSRCVSPWPNARVSKDVESFRLWGEEGHKGNAWAYDATTVFVRSNF